MLPSLGFLARERDLLYEVMRAQVVAEGKHEPYPDGDEAVSSRNAQEAEMPATLSPGSMVERERSSRVKGDGARPKSGTSIQSPSVERLDGLPPELLTDIAEHFLESPVWHACQLGAVSPNQGQVFMDESLWTKFFEGRFRKASRSPRRQSIISERNRSPSPSSVRLSYAQLHMLEMRFREGLYGARGALNNPRKGVAVLDLRIASSISSSDTAYTSAFAALRDGSVMMYDLGQESHIAQEPDERPLREPLRVAKEFAPSSNAGPALCCLPLTGAEPTMLSAGYTSGRLCIWELPTGRILSQQSLEEAHGDRVTSLASLANKKLLSASADGLVKAWDLGNERFGQQLQIYSGHGALVASVASPPHDGNHGGDAEHLFLTGGHDRTMRLWDARQAGVVARWNQNDWVTCVDFHPTAQHSVLSSDKCVHEWDLRRVGGAAISTRHRHRKLISRFRVDPLRLASCSLDGSVKVSSLEDPKVRRASPHSSPMSSPVRRPSEPPTDSWPMLGEGGDVCTLRASTDYVLSIDFDATRLLTGGVDSHVNVYDFTDPINFRSSGGSPMDSPDARPKCEPAGFHMSGFMELEN